MVHTIARHQAPKGVSAHPDLSEIRRPSAAMTGSPNSQAAGHSEPLQRAARRWSMNAVVACVF